MSGFQVTMVSDGRTDGQVQIYWTPQEPPLKPWSHKKTLNITRKKQQQQQKQKTEIV